MKDLKEKLHVQRVGASSLFKITKRGAGRIPKMLEGRFTSEGVALRQLKLWHRGQFPDAYKDA